MFFYLKCLVSFLLSFSLKNVHHTAIIVNTPSTSASLSATKAFCVFCVFLSMSICHFDHYMYILSKNKMSEKVHRDCLKTIVKIQIGSLLGTEFELNVSLLETVADVKRKIYGKKDIPINQQILLFRSQVLKDSCRLIDAGMGDGSKLTLVTSMRGGPISTRRRSLVYENHFTFKDLKEILEKSSGLSRPIDFPLVSIFYVKDGDMANRVRIVAAKEAFDTATPHVVSSSTRQAAGIFDKFVEDADMSKKMAELRRSMGEASTRRQGNEGEEEDDDVFSIGCWDEVKEGLGVYERSSEEDTEEEIALKDKHRFKPNKVRLRSNTKRNFERLSKKRREVASLPQEANHLAEEIAVLEQNACGGGGDDSFPILDGFRLAHLVLGGGGGDDDSSPEEHQLWERGGTACLMNKRQGVDPFLEVCSVPRFVEAGLRYERAPLYCRSETERALQTLDAKKYSGGARDAGDEPEAAKSEREAVLPPVLRKRARCNKCNGKLNVTTIHSCRCGRVFCSQHRYAEVHQCDYDYKEEGRKVLRQQNPMVVAEKIEKI